MKKLILLIKYLLITITLHVTSVGALPPKAPYLQEIQFEGLQGTAKWDSNYSQVDGYRLIYANYPSFTNIDVIELGVLTSYQRLLQNGDALFVAVQAYNADGDSELSNIRHFKLDKRIVALLPLTAAKGKLASGLSIKAGIEEALANGLWADNAKRVRWEIVDATSEIGKFSESEQLKTLYYGDVLPDRITTKNVRGYVNDPDVLAIVTTSTAASLALTSQTVENKPLIIAGTATSTILEINDNLMMMPASNKHQADKIYQKFSQDSETENRLLKYAVVLDSDIDIVAYSFDLYMLLLQNAFDKEVSIQQQASDTGDTSKPFAQLVGTLVFDGTEEQAELLASTLDVLAADVVFHIGFSRLFKMLYNKRPNLTCIGSDGTHSYKDYQNGDVMVLALEGEEYLDKASYNNHGYDTVGFLAQMLGELSVLELRRERVLQKTQETTYVGRTGTKGFVEKRGSYNILKATPIGWKKIN
ncbi:hypothetical protein QUF50_01285 [Thiotrichales bacterium HSG1]|nr:hypothetical protein [Thiotrichales bacterium HSG1]